MRHIALQLALAAGLGLLAGCVERIDHDPQAALKDGGVRWELRGEFGGEAEPVAQTSDPWETRFKPGGFKQVSGVCATDDEVWVCDLGISRIQIFDFDGRFLRSIGEGVPLEGTLPTPLETHIESIDPEAVADERWELQHGEPWRSRRFELFRIADVVVTDRGYWAADWTKTSGRNDAFRDFQVYYKPFDGDYQPQSISGLCFPDYLAYTGNDLAISASRVTGLWALYREGELWEQKQLSSGVPFGRYMLLEKTQADNADYMNIYARMAGSGRDAGEFFLSGGVAIAFKKLLVCDTGNRRIQVFNVDRDKPERQGEIVRVINSRDSSRALRFGAPRDIDVDSEGRMYVLDTERLEVAVLDAGFRRIASFAADELLEPHAIDLSDDGRHCFISDRRFNKVLHYARTD